MTNIFVGDKVFMGQRSVGRVLYVVKLDVVRFYLLKGVRHIENFVFLARGVVIANWGRVAVKFR